MEKRVLMISKGACLTEWVKKDFNGLRKEALKWNRACFLSSEQQREGVNKMTSTK